MSEERGDQPKALSAWQVLKLPDYRIVWFTDLISGIGNGATTLAVMLLLTTWSDDPAVLAMNTIAGTLPMLLVAPFAGPLVDRWNRLKVIVVCRVLQALLVLSLTFMSAEHMWLAAVVIAAQFTLAQFSSPAAGAIFATVVPGHGRAGASGLGGASGFVSGAVGAGFAATMFSSGGLDTVFVVDAFTFLLAGLLFLRFRGRAGIDVRPDKATLPPYRQDLAVGIAFVFRNSAMRSLLIGFGSVTIASAAVNILYMPLALDRLHASSLGIFGIQAAAGVGTVVIGLSTGYLSRVLSDLTWFRICTLAYALIAIGYGFAWGIPILIALHFLMNCVGVRMMASAEVLMFAITPNRQLGRVGSAINAIERGFSILLNLAVVGMTGIIDFQTVLVIFGAVGGAVAIASGVFLTAARLAEADKQREDADKEFASAMSDR